MHQNTTAIFQDTVNFIKNNKGIIFMLLVILSLISLFFSYLSYSHYIDAYHIYQTITPNNSQENLQAFLQNASVENQETIKQLILHFSFIVICKFIYDCIYFAMTLSIISLIAKRLHANFANIIKTALMIGPSLIGYFIIIAIIMVAVSSLLMSLGSAVFILLPIAIIIFAIIFTLGPIILANEQKINVFMALQKSIKLGVNNIRILLPAILVYFIINILISYLIPARIESGLSAIIILTLFVQALINAYVNCFILVYIYRAYTLIKASSVY